MKSPSAIPANLTALFSADGGYSWNKLSNYTTVLSYMIASSPNQLPAYDASQIFNDLANYHDFSTSVGELRGWNVYVQSSELEAFNSIASWFQGATGKNFDFYASANTNVIDQLDLSNIISLPTTISQASCASFSEYLFANMNQIREFNEIGNATLLQQCSGVLAMVQDLNYMKYVGSTYESNSAGRILVVGDGTANNVTKYISDSYKVTYFSLENGSALEKS